MEGMYHSASVLMEEMYHNASVLMEGMYCDAWAAGWTWQRRSWRTTGRPSRRRPCMHAKARWCSTHTTRAYALPCGLSSSRAIWLPRTASPGVRVSHIRVPHSRWLGLGLWVFYGLWQICVGSKDCVYSMRSGVQIIPRVLWSKCTSENKLQNISSHNVYFPSIWMQCQELSCKLQRNHPSTAAESVSDVMRSNDDPLLHMY